MADMTEHGDIRELLGMLREDKEYDGKKVDEKNYEKPHQQMTKEELKKELKDLRGELNRGFCAHPKEAQVEIDKINAELKRRNLKIPSVSFHTYHTKPPIRDNPGNLYRICMKVRKQSCYRSLLVFNLTQSSF